MADDYARHALSQRAAFEATHPAVLAAAREFSEEPVLRVVDLGAADGVNSHGLIRALAEERAGRLLIYALVDLPTNAWSVAANHLRHAFGDQADRPEVIVIPAPGEAGAGGLRRRHRGPLRLGGGPQRGLPPRDRARPAPRHGDQPGGHSPPPGALPAVGQRARRGHGNGDALGRRRGRPGLDGVCLSGVPRPHRRSRAASLARGRGAAVGAAARDARHRARAGRPVHRRATRPPPLRARKGRGSTSRSSAT